jgi:competence protein ComFB
MVINCTEIAVRELFPEVLKSYQQRIGQVCTCQRCLDDIVALALNYLPPHYVASEMGTIITGVDYQQIGGRTEVFTQICNATRIVSENPRH